jgi:hypothetical protein
MGWVKRFATGTAAAEDAEEDADELAEVWSAEAWAKAAMGRVRARAIAVETRNRGEQTF